MSAFEKYFESKTASFPSDTARYFAKPLLADAFAAGRAIGRKDGKKKQPEPTADDIVTFGRAGASDANED